MILTIIVHQLLFNRLLVAPWMLVQRSILTELIVCISTLLNGLGLRKNWKQIVSLKTKMLQQKKGIKLIPTKPRKKRRKVSNKH